MLCNSRNSGSKVQRVYDKKVSKQDQSNIEKAVVTLSRNLLSDILIHVMGNKLLQHNTFDVQFWWILSGHLLVFKKRQLLFHFFSKHLVY